MTNIVKGPWQSKVDQVTKYARQPKNWLSLLYSRTALIGYTAAAGIYFASNDYKELELHPLICTNQRVSGPTDTCDGKPTKGYMMIFRDSGNGLPVLTETERNGIKAFIQNHPNASFNIEATGGVCAFNNNSSLPEAYAAGKLRSAVVAQFLEEQDVQISDVTYGPAKQNCKVDEAYSQRAIITLDK